ncbi:MAG TPA: SDR family NAD(P)-dependent oxidoreductase, partial [Caldilineae bacterium]|nr:SDR family NAD(P)-dependent oxidoreductase [Caldilineae bacterium]
MSDTEVLEPVDNLDIAIIGMAGRFPGASNLDEFWANLTNGVESIRFFTPEEMEAAGVTSSQYKDPHYVNAGGVLDDVDFFDAAFFGFYPREADIIDPQQRIFLETAWQALENAAYNPDEYDGLIGVYAGVSLNTYLLFNLMANPGIRETVHGYQLTIANDKDFLPTRVSYKLNLRGPSVNVQTACSTSLVATHMACQGLLDYQCDIALAGGVSIRLPQKSGYLYQEGGIASPDGHCRPFSADAAGTVGGDGVGIVVLKRLTEAIADGDHIYAVIKGTAINNDGSTKVGYTAPSVIGQAEVIATALALANVSPDTISYIEAHGTGTSLGDPIEIAALTQVFRDHSDETQFCAIGSVKSNIGHLDAAAGVAGLIKAALALYHKKLPPSINFVRPNPQIDFVHSPFYVQTDLTDWESDGESRRAAVSSFGMGGTNAHAVLEQAPAPAPTDPSRPWQLLLLSARSPDALDQVTANLTAYIQDRPDLDLADVAYTFQVGRRDFKYRRMAVVRDREEALAVLNVGGETPVLEAATDYAQRPVVFMFSGQGAQYPNMARDLYESETLFREQVDFCCDFLESELNLDLRTLLFPTAGAEEWAAEQLRQTQYTQPALFVVEYALAQLWMQWGIRPEAMIGHSIGEYVAACLAGVFSLEDALVVVAARGRMMQSLPGGSMLSVQLSEEELQPYIKADSRLSLATLNGPTLCALSGPDGSIDELEQRLDQDGHGYRRLRTSHAFHSQMMEPILQPFTALVASIGPNAPEIPFVSNVTGRWITGEEASDPAYWAKHLRQAVRFSDGLSELLQEPARVFLEVGPGNTLVRLAQWHPDRLPETEMLPSLRHPKQHHQPDDAFLLEALGRLWMSGVRIDWSGFYEGERRRRLPLPTYPFERQRYWIEPQDAVFLQPRGIDTASERKDIADWFYLPSWKRSDLHQSLEMDGERRWLVFAGGAQQEHDFVTALVERLGDVMVVQTGAAVGDHDSAAVVIDPDQQSDFDALLSSLRQQDKLPTDIVLTWCLQGDSEPTNHAEVITHLLHLTRSLGNEAVGRSLNIHVLNSNMLDVTGEEPLSPDNAAVLGFCRVVSQERPGITCRVIDLPGLEVGSPQTERLLDQLVGELAIFSEDVTVAYRGARRWVQTFEPIHLNEESSGWSRLRSGGVYLITGGLGRIGLVVAEYLAKEVQARLVLVGRTPMPERAQWAGWLESHGTEDAVSKKIRSIQALEALGAEVLALSADVADIAQMERVLAAAYQRFGALHGVVHSAGLVGEEAMRPIDDTSPQLVMQHFRPKVHGLQVMARLLKHHVLDFVLVQSSLSSVLGGLGMAAYAAANSYVDAFVVKQSRLNHTRWLSVDWDGWRFDENGKASNVPVGSTLTDLAITPTEGAVALDRILSLDHVSQIIVSTTDLDARLDQWVRPQPVVAEGEKAEADSTVALHPRPALKTNYIEPRTDLERSIVELWQDVLGIGPIGVEDDFFALGGHSLLATQIVSRLRDAHNVSLPLRELFESPTVAGLAKLIEGERRKAGENDLSRPTPIARDGALPLSSGQERLWFLDRLEPGSPLYNNFAAVRISGTIDGDVFEQSLQEIIQRHESLRTSFAESQGQALQIIHDEVDFRLNHIDLSAEPLSTRDDKVRTLALAEARAPFDLATVPLLRATLLHLDDRQHVLFLTMHHIISDGWSIGVLIQETTAVYEARIAGRPSPLQPLPIQYADYAYWQRQRLAKGALNDQVDYWKSQLADVPALVLPTTYARPEIQTSNGASIWFELRADIHQDLLALSHDRGATLFMTLLAALAALFHRYTLQDDFAIGSPIANRTDVETEGLIGFLLNTLVLRTDLSGDPTFVEFLERVRQTALDAYAHQDLPFELLVEALQPERDLSRTPFFQVMFDLQKTQQIPLSMPDVTFTPLRIDDGTAKFDMALSMEEGEQYLGGYLNYNTDLFDHSIPRSMLAHFQALLEAIVVDPNQRLSELSMLTPAEKAGLEAWSHAPEEIGAAAFVHRQFEMLAEQMPDAVALVWEGENLTYGELNRRVNQVTHRLSDLEVGPEQVVGLYFQRSVEVIVGMLAALKAGAAFVSLDLNYPAERLAYVLADAAVGVVLTQEALADDLVEHPVQTVAIDPDAPEIAHQPTANPTV